MIRASGTNSARVIQVIETKSVRGLGTEKDPAREVIQYWDLNGNFLAEEDTEHYLPIISYDSNAVKESILVR